jgi:tetratricopeptide (TPR) repeat protein
MKIKKNFKKIIISIVCSLLFLIVLPFFALQAGDIFFGKIKPLYNIRFAHFFYTIATHPLILEKPPRYAHYEFSRVYFIEGNLPESLKEAEKELELYPENTATFYILGLTYGYMNRSHDGIDAFSKYINTHPNTWAGRNDKAWLQFRVGDITGALETISPVVNNFYYTPWVQNTYCSLLIANKSYYDAEKVCNHAKTLIVTMNKNDWGHAYPGNDPRVYDTGLKAMKTSINENLLLIQKNK